MNTDPSETMYKMLASAAVKYGLSASVRMFVGNEVYHEILDSREADKRFSVELDATTQTPAVKYLAFMFGRWECPILVHDEVRGYYLEVTRAYV